MLRSRKNKSIVSILQDRELNNKCAPYFLSLNIISQLLRKNNSDALYKDYWKKSCHRPMTYDCGYLYFSNYTEFCSIYSEHGTKSFPMFKMQKSRAKMKISDVISYSIPVYKNIDNICKCELQACTCLSQCLLSVSEDNWLCQHLMVNGKLIREVYVNCFGQKFLFKYCDWDVYGDRFVLTSTLNPDVPKTGEKKKTDVVVKLAVFTMFPFEFLALLEIKRSVFGENCTAANISDQHLILGKGSFQVHIYSFEDFLIQGKRFGSRICIHLKYNFSGFDVGYASSLCQMSFNMN